MKKLLLVTTLNPDWELDVRQPPLGLGYLVSMIRRERPGQYEIRHADRRVAEALDEFQPDLVGISSTSTYFGFARRYAQEAKARGLPVVVGGIHISMLPESLYPEMDVAVMGEGERTMLAVLDAFEDRGRLDRERLRLIPGLAFREEDGALATTGPAAPIDPLDQVPPPDRTLFPVYRHAHMLTSRGCPYHCVFCASTRCWPGKVRFFSPEYVVAEIEDLVTRHGASLISFYDDLFCANVPRLKRIAELLRSGGLAGRVKFTASARANLVTDELAEVLKSMGVASVNMGLESGCDETLRFLKGGVTVQQNRRAVETLHRHGLFVQGSFIIGSPQETEAQMMETYRFLRDAPLAITDVSVLLPFPGTPVWDYAAGRGLVSCDMDWNRLTYGDRIDPKTIINLSEKVSSERLATIYRRFMWLRYYKILKNILFHPYRADLPRTAVRMAAGAVSGLARKAARSLAGHGAWGAKHG